MNMTIMRYSPAQIKAIVITPMISGSVSIVASGTLITTILKSETRLSVPSKRILFGLCVHDCLMSLSAILSSVPIPKEEGIWGAMGNVHTCDFQGFIHHVGHVGWLFYNCNLSIYYLCIIRFSMSDESFRKKVEPFCHLIPNLYALGGAIYLLSKGYFNSIGNMCWVGPYPMDCINDPDVECLRGGEDAYHARKIWLGYAWTVVWAFVIIIMVSLVFMVVMQRRRSNRWASGGKVKGKRKASLIKKDGLGDDEDGSIKTDKDPLAFDLKAMRAKTKRQSLIMKTPDSLVEKNSSVDIYLDPHPFDVKTARAAGRNSLRSTSQKQALEALRELDPEGNAETSNRSLCATTNVGDSGDGTNPNLNRMPSLRSSRRSSIGTRQNSQKRGPSIDEASREVKIQALLYILSFVVCNIFSVINRSLETRDREVPFIIFELGRVFNPIQGLFNVLVYCRPYVRGLRSHHPEYTWWKAFSLTVKSGGDNNASRDRSARKKPNKKVLDKIRQNHMEMMADIRQSRRSSDFDSRLRRSSSEFHAVEVNAKNEEGKGIVRLDSNFRAEEHYNREKNDSESAHIHDCSPSHANNEISNTLGEADEELGNDLAAVDGDKRQTTEY